MRFINNFATLLCLSVAGFGQTASNAAFRQIQDVPGLPRVLLIGDSISIGYTEPVRKALEGRANVHRISVNGGATIFGVKHLDEWLGASPWDVIHFNFGLHDLRLDDGKHQVPAPEYETNLRAIVKRLQQTKARLIWATTTPVPDGTLTPPRRSSDVPIYNAVARTVMSEAAITVNDLHALASSRLEELQLPANVHFKESGYDALGRQVASAILAALADGK